MGSFDRRLWDLEKRTSERGGETRLIQSSKAAQEQDDRLGQEEKNTEEVYLWTQIKHH